MNLVILIIVNAMTHIFSLIASFMCMAEHADAIYGVETTTTTS